MEIKRKTPQQLEVLEKLYSEDSYPAQSLLEKHAADLGLTYKQISGWFVEKRRREKGINKKIVSSHPASVKKLSARGRTSGFGLAASGKNVKPGSLNYTPLSCKQGKLNKNKSKKMLNCLQNSLSSEYIMAKIFRKDGPSLGAEFDSLPSCAFLNEKGFSSRNPRSAFQENQRATKKQKGLKQGIPILSDCIRKPAPVTKHGIGKGLMTVWRHTNPDAGDFPTGISFDEGDESIVSTSLPQTSSVWKRKPRHVPVTKQGNKLKDRRKHSMSRREVLSDREGNQMKCRKIKCDLALEQSISEEQFNHPAMLIDDEELELQELQAGPSLVTCCNHFAREGLHSCSLCKDLLPTFPPSSVKMRQLFKTQPWDSSPETVKDLFKVFHFLYTYAVVINICPFTLDEFAQAFHDKDSLLLGKVHCALLKLLLSDVESALSCGFLPHLSKSSRFLVLVNSLENKEYDLQVWKRSLNPLTWTELLRQVLVAALFGCNQAAMHRETLNKEINLMTKYGLRPGTLKGELFRVLTEQGNIGMKVSDLARLSEIVDLNLPSSVEELELLICSTLSSDITLFEKISSSTFRLRVNPATVNVDEFQSDTDSGSVDDVPANMLLCGGVDDSDCNSGNSDASIFRSQKSKNNMQTVCAEIDVSHPGEAWLLGLMDSEYSDLNVEEKLNALVALVDLLSDGTSLRTKDQTTPTVGNIPNCHRYGSGAKIKRSFPNQYYLPRPSWTNTSQLNSVQEGYNSLEHQLIDSSALILKFYLKETSKENDLQNGIDALIDLHPMQSLFLGSDRRYNRYWLFLGPCNAFDPGHRRVYFESSEDGHWEVIDSTEAFCALLSVLDDRGKREAFLIDSLEKRQTFLCEEMSRGIVSHEQSTLSCQSELDMVREESYSPVSDLDNVNRTEFPCNSLLSSGAVLLEAGNKREQRNKWSRLQAFDSWIWNSFYSKLHTVRHGKRSYLDSLARCDSCNDLYWRDERHCKICHTTFELDFDLEERYAVHTATCRENKDNLFPKHKILSSKLQSLKCAVHAIESVMPEDAMAATWRKSAHKLWIKRLRRTSSMAELLQVLADFLCAINKDWLYQCGCEQDSPDIAEEMITSYSSLPQTSSAVALLLVKLDALVSHYMERSKPEKHKQIHGRGNILPRNRS